MIFPTGKSRNNGFNPLADDAKSFRTHSQRQSADSAPDVLTAAQHIQQSKYADSVSMPRACSVGRAQCGNLSDIGGPVRQMKTSTSNSIWNHEVLAKIKAGEVELDKGEQIKADNKKLAEERQTLRKQNFLIDVEAVKAAVARGDLAKANSVQTSHATTSSNYSSKIASHQISMFDSLDKLEAAKDVTRGEEIKKAAEARRTKTDRSWVAASTPVSARQKLSAFFDNLKKSQGL